jgi:hypothetical protein
VGPEEGGQQQGGFTGSGVLHIEDCRINSFKVGIDIDPGNSEIFIKDTIVRNNAGDGIRFAPSGIATVTAHLDDTAARQNVGFGIEFSPSGSATVTASLDHVRTEKNDVGLVANSNTNVSVRNSVSSGNGNRFTASAFGGQAVINLESSSTLGNVNFGILSDGAGSTVNISNVTVVNNPTGLAPRSGGHIVSFANNKITNNTTNGSPTKTIAQH